MLQTLTWKLVWGNLNNSSLPGVCDRFISGPVVILVSNHVIDKWVREKVVNGVDLTITLLGHAFFLVRH